MPILYQVALDLNFYVTITVGSKGSKEVYVCFQNHYVIVLAFCMVASLCLIH